MDRRRRRNIARLLAPLALVLAVVAVVLVVQSTLGSDGSDDDADNAARQAEQRPRQDARQERRRQRAAYTVKLNDTLGLISEKTGVPVERIEALNPDLDPQNLIVGQRIKLRE